MSSARGATRRREIVDAAAALLREEGPVSVSHRSVARRAGCSLSSTTYYFEGLDDLLAEAGRQNISRWAARAERVAEEVEALEPPGPDDAVEVILAACLPSDEGLLGHYLQLVAAGASEPVSRSYRTGRSRLNAAIGRVLDHLGSRCTAQLVIAVIDGAAVSALSEGRDVRDTARDLLRQILWS